MTGAAFYLLLLVIGVGLVGALIAVDSWAWRRQGRRDLDGTWQQFSDGRWFK